MEQINFVHLRGHVGTVRTSVVGQKSVCNFSIATNRITRSADGAVQEETQWTSCVMWTNKKYPDLSAITVGAPVEVKGSLRTNRYSTSEGQEKSFQEVSVDEIIFIPPGEKLLPPVR